MEHETRESARGGPNRTDHTAFFTHALEERLAEANALDLELYAYARTLAARKTTAARFLRV